MKTLIIDDDIQAAKYLQEQLKEYPDVEVVGTAINGIDGLRLMGTHMPELLFLDIELPDISGIDFLERMDNYTHGHCRVVMYSAYDKFMLPAFRNRAFDFLVKPFDRKELRSSCSVSTQTASMRPFTRAGLPPRKIHRHMTTASIYSTPTPSTSAW